MRPQQAGMQSTCGQYDEQGIQQSTMQKAACSMHKARAHAPDELVRLGHLNQHDQSDHVCHCNCKALLCCGSVLIGCGRPGKEDCLRSVRTDCGRKQRVSCDWWARRVGYRAATSARGSGGTAMSSLITATIGRTRGATRLQQGAAIEVVGWGEEVTTSGSNFRGRGNREAAARGPKDASRRDLSIAPTGLKFG